MKMVNNVFDMSVPLRWLFTFNISLGIGRVSIPRHSKNVLKTLMVMR